MSPGETLFHMKFSPRRIYFRTESPGGDFMNLICTMQIYNINTLAEICQYCQDIVLP